MVKALAALKDYAGRRGGAREAAGRRRLVFLELELRRLDRAPERDPDAAACHRLWSEVETIANGALKGL